VSRSSAAPASLPGFGEPPRPPSGLAVAIKLSTGSLNFGTVPVGQTSPSQTVTVTNLSSYPVNITGAGITIVGTAAGDYSETNDCGSSIAPLRSCMITVKFKPTKTGTRNAILEVNDNGGGSPQTAALLPLPQVFALAERGGSRAIPRAAKSRSSS